MRIEWWFRQKQLPLRYTQAQVHGPVVLNFTDQAGGCVVWHLEQAFCFVHAGKVYVDLLWLGSAVAAGVQVSQQFPLCGQPAVFLPVAMSGSIGNQRLLAHRHGVLCSSANAALAALQQVLDFHAGVLQLGSTRCLVDKLSSPSSCSAACNQSTSFARRHVQVSHHLPQRVKPSGAAAHAAAARGFIGRQLQQQHLHQPCHSWQECETQQQQQQQSAAWRHSSSKQTRLQAEWQHGSSLMPCSSKVPTEPQPVQHPLASSSHSSRSAILCNRSRFSTNSGLAINSWYPVRGFSSTAAPAAVAAMAQQASMLEELQKALEADESQVGQFLSPLGFLLLQSDVGDVMFLAPKVFPLNS